jgi:eukaryotic-like serine/threonine-protein kinase
VHADHGEGEWPPFGSPHGGRSPTNEGPVAPTNGRSASTPHSGWDGNGHRPPADETLSAAPSLLASRFELVRPIGGGAITRVLEARDRLAHRLVALKFPVKRLAGDQAFLERLERAVSTAAGVAHPNVAAVHAVERDRGGAFVVVELVNGSSLLEMLEARGPMPPTVAAKVAADVCAALAAAHAKGVAHGHLTPANILLTIDGRVKVTDFALAQAGSPSAPPAEPAADLRALGRCLGAMLTGREPLEAPARPAADVPAGLAAIIARLVDAPRAGEGAEAYRSAADAGRDLARFAAATRPGAAAPDRRAAAPALSPAPGPPPAAAAAAGAPTVAAGPDRPGAIRAAPGAPGSPSGAARSSPGAIGAAPGGGRRRRLALLAAAAAAAATVGVVAALGLGRQPGTPAAGQAPPPPTTAALATIGEPATTLAAPTTLAPTTASPATTPPTATDGRTTTSRRPEPERRVVPNVVGLRRGQAADALAQARLGVLVQLVPAKEPGQVQRVIAQLPAAGELAPAGSEVTILVGTKGSRG